MRSDTRPHGTILACTTLQHGEAAPHFPAPHTLHRTCPHPTCTLHHALHHTRPAHHTLNLVLHHALHHSRPAPHCTTPACTTFALHHTLDLVLHHTAPPSPAPHCTTSALHHICPAPHLPAPHSPCTTSALYHTRLHHIRPAPQLPCTTPTLHHTRLYTIRPAPQLPCTILNHTRLHSCTALALHHTDCTAPYSAPYHDR